MLHSVAAAVPVRVFSELPTHTRVARECEARMARKNLFLMASLIVMVGALLFGILWTDPGEPAPAFGPPGEGVDAHGVAERQLADGEADERGAVTTDREVVESTPGVVAATAPKLRGRLVDGQGSPRAGVEVWLAPQDETTRQSIAETDADGVFEFAMGTEHERALLTLSPSSKLLFEASSTRRMDVTGAARSVDLGDLAVVRASVIAGRVVDDAGQPIEGATVKVREAASLLGTVHGSETEADGSFEFALEPCTGRLLVSARGFMPVNRPLTVELGVDQADMTIRLEPGATIGGSVVDDLGAPIAGARVAPYRVRRIGGNTVVDRLDASEAVTTDEAGVFELSGIEPGDSVRLRAWANGHSADVKSSVAAGTKDVEFVLARFGRIRGKLVDGAGRPIAGSDVEVLSDEMVRESIATTTDASGEFELISVTSGSVRVRATGRHRPVASDAITVRSGEVTDGVRLVADVGAAVAVLVLDGKNRPVAGARVRVTIDEAQQGGGSVRRIERRVERDADGERSMTIDSDDPSLGSGTTDEDGRVLIAGLPAGPAAVLASHPDHANSRPVRVVLPRAGEVEAQLTLRAGGRVDVTVVDANGNPKRADFIVRGPLAVGEAGGSSEHTSDENGRAVVGPLVAGSYEAVLLQKQTPMQVGDMGAFISFGAESEEIAGSNAKFVVEAEATADVQLVFPVLTTVFGVVRDAEGPVSGVMVSVEPDGEESPVFGGGRSTRTDAAGRFEIDDVAAGSYSIRWARPGAIVKFVDTVEIPVGLSRLERDLELAGGTVRVRVHDEPSSEPIEGAMVTLTRVDGEAVPERRRQARIVLVSSDADEGEESMSMTTGGPGSVSTDEAGVAEIKDVPPGTYRVAIRQREHEDVVLAEVVVSAGSVTEPPSVRMKPGGFLRGKVTGFAEDDRFPFASVEVEAVGHSAESREESAMNGTIQVDGLAPGKYRARARQPQSEHSGPWVEFEITAGERTRIRLPLE